MCSGMCDEQLGKDLLRRKVNDMIVTYQVDLSGKTSDQRENIAMKLPFPRHRTEEKLLLSIPLFPVPAVGFDLNQRRRSNCRKLPRHFVRGFETMSI